MERCVGDYIFLQKIGAGSFATVWKAQHRITGDIVAIKEIVANKHQFSPELIAQEQAIMASISHPQIVKLLGIIQGEVDCSPATFLVMEFCEGGDLDRFILIQKKLDVEVTRTIMIQLAAALQELRRKNLIHRDLKPHNLLLKNRIDSPGDGGEIVVKLTDFGLARTLQPQGMARTVCGTYLYMAPEVILRKKYDVKADLWSVGVMLYLMVTGRKPFAATTEVEYLKKLANKVEFLDEDGWDRDCRSLCEGLLRNNPVERISFDEFFRHKFLRRSSKVDQGLSVASDGSVSYGDQRGDLDGSGSNGDERRARDVHQRRALEGIGSYGDRRQPLDERDVHQRRALDVDQYRRACDGGRCVDYINFERNRLVAKLPRSLETIAEHHRQPKERPKERPSVDPTDESEYVIVEKPASPRSSARNKHHCPIPRSPASSSQSPLGRNSASHGKPPQQSRQSDPERCETLRICAKQLEELAGLRNHRKLEALSIYMAALGTLKAALAISTTPQLFRDLSTALDKATAIAESLGSDDTNKPLPDAAGLIYQAAAAMGRAAAADDLLDRHARASVEYAKASTLFYFLVMEDSPLELDPSDAIRVRGYLAAITKVHKQCKERNRTKDKF